MYLGLIKEGVAPEGGLDLANGALILEGETTYRTYLYYGNFIQQIINFLLIAFSLFIIVKVINKIRDSSDKAKAKLEKLASKNTAEKIEE